MRRVAGQPMQLGQRHRTLPAWPTHLDGCIERDQRNREVGRVGGDAVVAGTEHRMPTVLSTNRGAAGTRRAFVAGGIADVAKVRAAGALQEVATHRRLIAHLRARRVQKRLRDDGKLLDHDGMGRHLRHCGGGAEPQALRAGLDAVVEKACKTDQPFGPAHVLPGGAAPCRCRRRCIRPGASLRPAWARKESAAARSRGRSRVKGCMAQPPRPEPVARAAS